MDEETEVLRITNELAQWSHNKCGTTGSGPVCLPQPLLLTPACTIILPSAMLRVVLTPSTPCHIAARPRTVLCPQHVAHNHRISPGWRRPWTPPTGAFSFYEWAGPEILRNACGMKPPIRDSARHLIYHGGWNQLLVNLINNQKILKGKANVREGRVLCLLLFHVTHNVHRSSSSVIH